MLLCKAALGSPVVPEVNKYTDISDKFDLKVVTGLSIETSISSF